MVSFVSTFLPLLILFYHRLSHGSAQPEAQDDPFNDQGLGNISLTDEQLRNITSSLTILYMKLPNYISSKRNDPLADPPHFLYLKVLFSHFREHFVGAFGKYAGDNNFGENNRFLVLLNDHCLLPVSCAIGGDIRRSIDLPFPMLSSAWFTINSLLEFHLMAPPAYEVPITVPEPLRPLLQMEEEETTMQYGEIRRRFDNYAFNYPLGHNRLGQLFAGNSEINFRRLAYLHALFGLIVMQPYTEALQEQQQQQQLHEQQVIMQQRHRQLLQEQVQNPRLLGNILNWWDNSLFPFYDPELHENRTHLVGPVMVPWDFFHSRDQEEFLRLGHPAGQPLFINVYSNMDPKY